MMKRGHGVSRCYGVKGDLDGIYKRIPRPKRVCEYS